MTGTAEFPGFHVPEAPVFNGVLGTSMFHGDLPTPVPVLDLGMVFGSRLWGHDVRLGHEVVDAAPGLGDLYTHELRELACAALRDRVARELHEPADGWRALVLHTGSEAVETAIKTALRATGRERMVAWEGGYHGTFGLALAVTHRREFREPWKAQLADTVRWAPWGVVPALDPRVACVVVEPWQGRAGVQPPPRGFLALLREECDRVGALLVLDAVMCGAGRTGPTIAEAIADARPDLVCLGKAIGCGVAASAVVARTEVAQAAWERGRVEPAHTGSMIGDPVACSGILRALDLLDRRAGDLVEASRAWRTTLEPLAARTGLELRGTGLLWALDTYRVGHGVELSRRLLVDHRVLVVPSGQTGSSITLYPPATCSDLERERTAEAIAAALD